MDGIRGDIDGSSGTRTRGSPGARDNRALYEIIRDQLVDAVTSGRTPAGAMLPSIREITVEWNVSTTMARKALAELVRKGYAHPGARGHVAVGARRHFTFVAHGHSAAHIGHHQPKSSAC